LSKTPLAHPENRQEKRKNRKIRLKPRRTNDTKQRGRDLESKPVAAARKEKRGHVNKRGKNGAIKKGMGKGEKGVRCTREKGRHKNLGGPKASWKGEKHYPL